MVLAPPYAHGLVVGRFYPPHAGHHHLVDTAAAACMRLSVVVCAVPGESIPLEDRVAWVRSAHVHLPHLRVAGVTGDPADVAVVEAALATDVVVHGGPPEAACVDAVFSRGPYGPELARRLGAVHVDGGRHPLSGAAVREDVAGRWADLAPPTRAGLALRVVVLGAESTGSTTVSQLLAGRLRERGGVWAETSWVPEYGREFTDGRLAAGAAQAKRAGRPYEGMADMAWTPEDHVAIAAGQSALEDAGAAAGSPVVVCDSDAFATGIWFSRYCGGRSPAVEALARRHPLYLLTDPAGVPFVADHMRDSEHLRDWMTDEFAARLDETGRRWQRLTGPLHERVDAAESACDDLLARGWSLPDPYGA